MLHFAVLHDFIFKPTKQKVAKTRVSTTFERTLRVDYDNRVGKTGRKVDGNWTSLRDLRFLSTSDLLQWTLEIDT